MFEILNKQILAEDIKRIDIYAPNISEKVRPGQFVGVCPEEGDERIPLTVTDWDGEKGIISLIFIEIGDTTRKLGSLPINESIFSIIGPLGVPSRIDKFGKVVCIATGIGAAQILPINRSLKNMGNKVTGIIGAKSKKLLMLEPQMRLVCNKLFITTNDGSYERRGKVTDVLKEFINKGEVDFVYAIGSVDMMQEVATLTKKKDIRTYVQLKPVMVDCVGMCGACRVKIAGKILRACIDGPEFDAHKVDFIEYKTRMKYFKEIDGCQDQGSQHKHRKKGLKTLMRSLSDFLSG